MALPGGSVGSNFFLSVRVLLPLLPPLEVPVCVASGSRVPAVFRLVSSSSSSSSSLSSLLGAVVSGSSAALPVSIRISGEKGTSDCEG